MFTKNPVNTDIVEKYLGFPLLVKALSGVGAKVFSFGKTYKFLGDHGTDPTKPIPIQTLSSRSS
ncbi:MAG: hypothetical protein WB014_10420 [Methanosarcina sp.]